MKSTLCSYFANNISTPGSVDRESLSFFNSEHLFCVRIAVVEYTEVHFGIKQHNCAVVIPAIGYQSSKYTSLIISCIQEHRMAKAMEGLPSPNSKAPYPLHRLRTGRLVTGIALSIGKGPKTDTSGKMSHMLNMDGRDTITQ